MDAPAVRQVRSFNRTVAERIGALNDRFLCRDRPMGEARLLWEIGPAGAEIRHLRERLGLDSGYVSRVVRSLEEQGLVQVRDSARDGRVRRVVLTDRGLGERAELDRRSDTLAAEILSALSERQKAALIASMEQVERLLEASMVSFSVEDPASADARWCFKQYFAELGMRFEGGFDPSRSIPAEARELRRPAGVLVIARLRGETVGCGALKFHGAAPAELKRMWVRPSARGLGVGRRLLTELERQAREAGVRVIRLETNRALREAIDLYRRSGYIEVDAFNAEPYADHWFEKHLSRVE